MRQLTSPESLQEMVALKKERDNYKVQVADMTKFLQDYGLKWVGGEEGQNEGEFNKEAIK